ncbi:hypothetical protein SS50377_22438 [Spironucleus salmonicida]|uniref:Uncharacterized protein n=1 Tax=Spironucleus salmonicida TaxID=348837 RepID=V6LEF0_9EUKA|nr:hypothetical protein SS50377_22438 [Spironucleus salmonicida]|eukprot:EST42071.1 hypothetical protein SS50377_18378 [Spironucleus salmonicida]
MLFQSSSWGDSGILNVDQTLVQVSCGVKNYSFVIKDLLDAVFDFEKFTLKMADNEESIDIVFSDENTCFTVYQKISKQLQQKQQTPQKSLNPLWDFSPLKIINSQGSDILDCLQPDTSSFNYEQLQEFIQRLTDCQQNITKKGRQQKIQELKSKQLIAIQLQKLMQVQGEKLNNIIKEINEYMKMQNMLKIGESFIHELSIQVQQANK